MGLFCLYLVHQRQFIAKKVSKFFIIATLLLPLTIFLSYSSFFVFWIVIYNFLLTVRKNSKFLPLLVAYSFICILFIAFVFRFDLRYTLSNSWIFSCWKDYFLCTGSFQCFMKSFGEGMRKLSVWWFGNSTFFRRTASFTIPFFVFSLFGYGFKSLRSNKFRLWDLGAVGLVIFGELFILGIMQKYPFTGARMTLFFAPFVFYFIVKGISSLRRIKPLYLTFSFLYIILLIACSFNSLLAYLRLYG